MTRFNGNPKRLLLFVDQGLYAASNFLLTVTASALLVPEAAGAVAAAFLVSVIATALQRSLVGEPLAADHRRLDAAWFSDAAGSTLGASSAGAALIAIGAVLLALGQGGEARLLTLWAAVWVPIVVLQDALRYVAHAEQRYAAVAMADGLWLLTQILGAVALWVMTPLSTAPLVIATWGAGAVVSLIALTLTLRPRIRSPRAWLRAGAPLGRWLLAQQSLGLVSGQVVLLFLGAALGAAALGGLRAAQSVFMPVGALFPAAMILALNQGSADQAEKTAARRGITTGVPAATAVFVLVAVLLAPFLMGRVYGAPYREFASLALPLGLAVVCQAAAIAPGASLRASNRGRAVLMSQLIATGVGIPLVVVLAVADGVRGAAWALAAQALVLTTASWWLYVRSLAGAGLEAASARNPT